MFPFVSNLCQSNPFKSYLRPQPMETGLTALLSTGATATLTNNGGQVDLEGKMREVDVELKPFGRLQISKKGAAIFAGLLYYFGVTFAGSGMVVTDIILRYPKIAEASLSQYLVATSFFMIGGAVCLYNGTKVFSAYMRARRK